ncbi:MAG TPA: LysR family transcriptional regulator, partial [Stellaceae bacterium]|nr:LysR family transcriptional regulator [Stellaceae bacterium]
VSAAEGVREAVFAGLGLTISSEWIFTPELASGAVETALDDWHLPEMDLWAVPGGPPRERKSPRIRSVRRGWAEVLIRR